MLTKPHKIGFPDYLAFGLGSISSTIPTIIVGAFLAVYMTDNVGLSAAVVGLVILVLRIAGCATDLLMGYVIDRTRSRYGKARPWIFVGALATPIFLYLLFNLPDEAASAAKTAYFTLYYFLLTAVAVTILTISSTAVMPMLSDEPGVRDKMGALGMGGMVLGGIVATATASMLLSGQGYTDEAYTNMSLVFGAAILLTGLFAFIRLREKEDSRDSAEKLSSNVSPSEAASALMHNKYFFLAIGASLIINLNNAVISGGGVYFCRDVLNNAGLFTWLSIAMLVPIVLGIPLASALVRRFGKHLVSTAGMLIALAGFIIAALAALGESPNIVLFFAGHVICGLGRSAYSASFYAIMAEICDYSEWKSNVKIEGVIFSSLSVGNKAGAGFGAAILGWILALALYNGELSVQLPATIMAERNMILFTPIVSYALVAILLFLCNLDKINPTVRAELDARRAAQEEAV